MDREVIERHLRRCEHRAASREVTIGELCDCRMDLLDALIEEEFLTIDDLATWLVNYSERQKAAERRTA